MAEIISKATALHQHGNLEEARRLYRSILSAKPDQLDVLHSLGVLEAQQGHYEEAHRLLSQLLRINPGSAEAHLNLGNVLTALNRMEDALANYDRALAIKPGYAEAFNNRGNALQDLKRYGEALASYDRALALKPGYAEALNNRGNALQDLKRHAEALASYDNALVIKPSYAQALNNRGNALQELRRYEEALTSYDRALALDPGYVEALNNRGNALHDLKQHEEALASYDRALALVPDYADALNSRGNALHDLKRHAEALANYDRALAIEPDYTEALNNRGNVLRELKRYAEAIKDFERVLSLKPDYEYAIGAMVNLKMQCCDWRTYIEESRRLVADVQSGKRSTPPFAFIAVSDSAPDQLLCSQISTRDKFPASTSPTWNGERYRHDRIRLAYLSADFHDHATAYLMAGLFEKHDKARFETIAVSFGSDNLSETRTRLKGAFERFIDVRQNSDREVANLLRRLEVDIAVDLKGFTLDARAGIFALRSAPVQVNYLGYPGTLGAAYIDYILADRWVIPEEHHACYTERVVYLPDTYQVNDSGRRIAKRTPTRAEAGLPENGFVFCSFNNSYKITPTIFEVWMRLLRRVEGSVLWLLGDNVDAMRNLRREASARGVSPARLVFALRAKPEDHLPRHLLADLFLDTLPYNAHTTASDALWAGIPVLTCLGTTFAGRVAASLLDAVGLPELITRSLDDYEGLALKLATDPTLLAGVIAKLARNRKTYPLFDTDRFRRHLEAAYVTMWERWQRGEQPASFAVEPIP